MTRDPERILDKEGEVRRTVTGSGSKVKKDKKKKKKKNSSVSEGDRVSPHEYNLTE